MAKISTNPEDAARVILGGATMAASIIKASGLPPKESSELLLSIVSAILADYKEAVIDELLETQKSTNEALAAATGRKDYD